MENEIEFHICHFGKNPTRYGDKVRKFPASAYDKKDASGWTRLDDLDYRITLHSPWPESDDTSGQYRVLAKVSREAARLLGLPKREGWYATDISPKHI